MIFRTIGLTRLVAVAGLLLLGSVTASAHESSLVDIRMDMPPETLQVEMDLVDLDYVLKFSGSDSGQILAGDVRNAKNRIYRYIEDNLEIADCSIARNADTLGIRNDARPSIVAEFAVDCNQHLAALSVTSRLFSEIPDYKSVVTVDDPAGPRFYVLQQEAVAIPIIENSVWNGFSRFVDEGFRHILVGFDHLLFLFLLALPIARLPSIGAQLRTVAGIVTAFTIAHSITLTLSSLGYLSLPASIVEPIIAASIVVTALLNLTNMHRKAIWLVAYLFGLIHGFGFAGAFSELVSGNNMHWSNVLAFNVGVEIGQLLVTVLILGVLLAISRFRYATPKLLHVGSAAAGIVGVVWLVERVV